MPRPLPALILAAAGPLLGLAVHATATHAAAPAPQAAATLPNNLCSQCHGGRSVPSSIALSAGDLIATRDFLQAPPRG